MAIRETDKRTRQLHLPVEGMTCAACVDHVEGALKGVEGVASVRVTWPRRRPPWSSRPVRRPWRRLSER